MERRSVEAMSSAVSVRDTVSHRSVIVTVKRIVPMAQMSKAVLSVCHNTFCIVCFLQFDS